MRALLLSAAFLATSIAGLGNAQACEHGEAACAEHDCCEGNACAEKESINKVALSSIDQAEVKLAVDSVMGMKDQRTEQVLTAETLKKLEADTQALKVSIRQRGKVNLADAGAIKKSCCDGNGACCTKSQLMAKANAFDGQTKTVERGCKHHRQ